MARRTKTQEKEIEFATGSADQPKRDLIAIQRALEKSGLAAQAHKLGKVISRLGRWQHLARGKERAT